MDRRIYSFTIAIIASAIVFSSHANAASLRTIPSSLSLERGQQATVSVVVDAAGEAVNAIAGDLLFNTDLIELTSVSKSGSVLGLWVQEPTYSNSEGKAHFEGIALNPGFTGVGGKIITFTVRGKAEGSGDIAFGSASVLANDGQGTNILAGTQKLVYAVVPAETKPAPIERNEQPTTERGTSNSSGKTVTPTEQQPAVQSRTHPDQDSYSNADTIGLEWDVPPGSNEMQYTISSTAKPKFAGDVTPVRSQISFDATQYEDGVWYFSARFKTATGWTNPIIREIRIDRTPPKAFSVAQKVESPDPTNPRPAFEWATTDKTSGIARYEAKIDDGSWIDASTLEIGSYIFPPQTPGKHTLLVRAYDAAGNITESSTTFTIIPIASPRITSVPATIHSPQESLVVIGEGISGTVIHVVMRKGTEMVSFDAPVDRDGLWRAEYRNRISGGSWELSAVSEDVRGAMSEPTPSLTIRVIGSTFDEIRSIGEGGLVGLAAILAIALLVWIAYWLAHRFHVRRVRMKHELTMLKLELDRDITALEKDTEAWRTLTHSKDGKQLANDIERIRADIKEKVTRITKRSS